MSRMCFFLNNKLLSSGSHRLSNTVKKHAKTINYLHSHFAINRSYIQKSYVCEHFIKHSQLMHRKSRYSSKSFDDVEGADDENFDIGHYSGVFDFSTPEETKLRSVTLRNQLYPDSKDPLTNHLKECSSEEEVFKTLEENYSFLNAEHLSQAVLILRDVRTCFGNSMEGVWYNSYVNLRSKYSKAKNGEFGSNLTAINPRMLCLLEKMNEVKDQFNINALGSSIMYLQKMGVPLTNPTQISLMTELEKLIDSSDHHQLPASVLSKYSTIMRIHYKRWNPLYLAQIACSKAQESLDLCSNLSDLKHISIFYQNCGPLVTNSIMENFKTKLRTLIKDVDSTEPNTLLRIMFFLHQNQWRVKNYDMLVQLLNSLKERNVHFPPRFLLDLTEIFPGNCEPYSFLVLLNKQSASLEKLKNGQNDHVICFLQSVASNYSIKSQHDLKVALSQSLLNAPSGQESMFYLSVLYNMLQNIKSSTRQFHISYWSRVLKLMGVAPKEERAIPGLLHIMNRYLAFNSKHLNNRHHKFELMTVTWLMQDLKTAVEKYCPSYFCRAVAFLLVYGNFRNLDYLDASLKKLLNTIHRLSINDWFTISLCLFSAMELKRKQTLSPEFLQQFVQLSGAMNQAALDYLKKTPCIGIKELGLIARSYQYRHGVVHSDLFLEIIKRYRDLKVEDISPKFISEILRYLLIMDYFVPELLDTLAECVVKHNRDLKANVAETLLQACFSFGYAPRCSEIFFPVAVELVTRDKQNLQCLHLIRAAVSLAYFYQLPASLIQSIFNIEFLDMVDKEIKVPSVKVSYAMKTRKILMELNRTVCLDYPEHDIPWFHARYCEELRSRESSRTSSFHEDVHDVLVHLLGDKKQFLSNVLSPYFYKIDFQIFLDRKEQAVEAKLVKNPAAYTRVAVLLLNKGDISRPCEQLKGFGQLRQRHLELMGYQVVSISPILWNTMFMAEKSSKANYLREKIWTKHKDS